METKPIKKHLNRLLLDPNNYRFIDRPEYKPVSDGPDCGVPDTATHG